MNHLPILAVAVLAIICAPAAVIADDEKNGHGAGGVRAEHASDKGLEQGKAWAGSKDKKDKKHKKDKKDKKDKKNSEQ